MKKNIVYEVILFIIIFLLILSLLLLNPINDLDEIWNYNFARNIANGLIPYRDFNILQMPLLPIICGIVLKLTINRLIIMRILAAILCSTILYVTYKLFKVLGVKKEVCILFTFFIGYLFKDVFCIDYNYLSLLITLIIIYREIKIYKENNEIIKCNAKQDFVLGIFAALTLLTKQTSGFFVCIALLGNKLVFVRKKEQVIIWFKSFLYRLLGIIIPVIFFIIYLIINNAFGEFVNYTILGIFEFSNKISYNTLIKLDIVGILSILVPLMFIYEWIRTIILEKDKIIYIFLVYGLAIFVVSFPISNKIHFLIGATPTIIVLLYLIYNLVSKVYRKVIKNQYIEELILNFLTAFIMLFSICLISINLYYYLGGEIITSKLNNFINIPISQELEEEIKNVSQYIEKEKKVKILDASAAIYMIPIDRYHKNYDMLLKGNLGKNGEQKIIQEISEKKDVKYLILKDEFSKNWQIPLKIIDYVKNNKTKIGEIGLFDIYQ